MPGVFEATLRKAEEAVGHLSKENAMLKELNEKLNKSIKETQEKLVKCPVTGLYNYEFFKNYLKENWRSVCFGIQTKPSADHYQC